MSHVILDGRTLTDAERMKVCADMETEDKRARFDDLCARADTIVALRKQLDSARSRAAQIRADLYSAEAYIGEILGKLAALGAEQPR